MVAKVLGKTGAHIKAHEMMHNAVVQEVFHHMVSRQNAGMTERKGNGWELG